MGDGPKMLLVGLALVGATSVLAQPRIQFEPGQVVATGITPKGQAVWFGVTHDRPRVYLRVALRERVVTDDDGDGRVALDVAPEVPPLSIWAVVDLTTGSYDLAAPVASSRRGLAFPATALPGAGAGIADGLTVDFRLVDVLLVRPGAGAWIARVGKGGPSDRSARRARSLQVAFAGMRAVAGNAAAPGTAQAGDTIVVIEPNTLEFFATRVGARP